FTSLMHLIKGCVGIGVYGMPLAVAYAGLLMGPAILLLVGIVSVHCMHLLKRCAHLHSEKTGSICMDYAQLAAKCTEVYFPNKGNVSRVVVNAFLVFTQLGFCCAYVVFITDSIKQAIPPTSHPTPQYFLNVSAADGSVDLDVRIWMVIVFPFLVLFSFIRTLKFLVIVSGISNVITIFGIVGALNYASTTLHDTKSLPLFANWSTLPLTFALSVYAYEGIGVVLPVENMMRTPRDFTWVLNLAMSVVVILYLVVGTMGYISCAAMCKGSFTLNLPDTPFYTTLKLLIAGSMFLTYFLQFYVPVEILLPSVLKRVSKKYQTVADLGFRTSLVLVTVVLAACVPRLEDVIAVIGSLASTTLCMTFPAAMDIASLRMSSKLTWYLLLKDIVIILIGITGSVTGLYMSMAKLIRFWSHGAKVDL
ncbi:predicted protein, partial [Nematostella vectensis]